MYKIRFALRKNVVEVMLDTSGDGLHKRGYRKNATLAPIKETLAATIADAVLSGATALCRILSAVPVRW